MRADLPRGIGRNKLRWAAAKEGGNIRIIALKALHAANLAIETDDIIKLIEFLGREAEFLVKPLIFFIARGAKSPTSQAAINSDELVNIVIALKGCNRP